MSHAQLSPCALPRPRTRQRQATLENYMHLPTRTTARVRAQGSRRVVVSLFSGGGDELEPWASRGFDCWAFVHSQDEREWTDHSSGPQVGVSVVVADLTNVGEVLRRASFSVHDVVFACASPPSRDLSVAGARFWKQKALRDPLFQRKAVKVVLDTHDTFASFGCPFFVLNPATSKLCDMWRPPSHKFSPCDFGGYLSADEAHPIFPGKIPNQDAYVHSCGVWCGGGFVMPLPRPVEPVFSTVVTRGKIRRVNPMLYCTWGTKGVRSTLPRGFVRAVCLNMLGLV